MPALLVAIRKRDCARMLLVTNNIKRFAGVPIHQMLHGFFAILTCVILSGLANPEPTTDAALVAPLYVINSNFTSVVRLRNASDTSVRIVLSFDALEGEHVAQRVFELTAYSNIDVDVDRVEMAPHRFPRPL